MPVIAEILTLHYFHYRYAIAIIDTLWLIVPLHYYCFHYYHFDTLPLRHIDYFITAIGHTLHARYDMITDYQPWLPYIIDY